MTNKPDKRCVFDEQFKTFRFVFSYFGKTSHINFLRYCILTTFIFRLYPGNSLYAFCITPELILEHLYWGKSLNGDYDLRYLSESSRMAVSNDFNSCVLLLSIIHCVIL